jgi:hypothetical protein
MYNETQHISGFFSLASIKKPYLDNETKHLYTMSNLLKKQETACKDNKK